MQKYINSVASSTGAPVGGASVQVNVYPGGTPATIYSDNGITQAANPLTTDLANGSFSFYAPDGHYQLVVTGSNIQPITLNDVLLVDAIPSDQAVASSVNSSDILSIQQGGTLKQATGALVASMVLGADSPIPVANGGTGATTAANARTNLGAAASGANGDITSLTGLTTPLALTEGGTGASTATGARTALGLGSMATQNANNVSITGGSMAGVTLTDLASTSVPGGAGLIGFDGGSLANQILSRLNRVVDSISALRSISKTTYTRAFVTGYYSAGDGGGGVYWYDPSDTTSSDNGGTIIVAADSARWKLQYTGPVSVKQFGAKGDGVQNDTTYIQAALNAILTLFIPDGTYLVDTLYFPNSPSDTNPIGGKFVGGPNSIFLQRTANTALFKKVQTAGRLYDWEIGPFSVRPAAGASSTVSAFFTSGFTNCTFNRIQGLSNGTAGFYALFDVSASPYLSYFNTFNNPTLIGTSGYTKCFHFNNNGTGNNGNSNGNTINQPAIYNNSGMASGIDCNLSYSVTINNPYIEANTGMTAIVMGPGTMVNGGALEANGLDFSYTGSNTPFGTIVTGTELATAHNVDFGNAAFGNIWIGVQETGTATWINVNGQSNQKVQLQFSNNPSTPTMSQTLGTTGTIASVSSTVTQGYAQLTRQARLAVRMQFTPVDLSNTRLSLTAPSGWTLAEVSFGIIDSVTGISVKSATSINGEVYFTPTTTNVQYVDYWCTLVR